MNLSRELRLTKAQIRWYFGSKYLFDDPNLEQKIKAALERKIYSIGDISLAALMFRDRVEGISLKHCPDDHEANMSRRSTATKEQLAELKDTLRNAITIE